MEELEQISIVIETMQKELELLKHRQASLRVAKENREKNPYFKGSTRKLADFFYSKGYLIVEYCDKVSENYSLAKQVYACNDVSRDFITRLLKSNGEEYKFEAGSLSNEAFTKLCNLCTEMQKKKMLSFTLEKRTFSITPTLKGKDRLYLSGGCYEEANRYLIDKTIREFSHELSFKIYRNVRLKKADSTDKNKNDMELDFIVEFKDRFYIFETKAGKIMAIDRWVDRTRLFADEKNKFITCCLQEFNPLTFKPFLLFPMKTLEKNFKNLLKREFQPAPNP